jgi:hypothetical protein
VPIFYGINLAVYVPKLFINIMDNELRFRILSKWGATVCRFSLNSVRCLNENEKSWRPSYDLISKKLILR